MKVVFINQPWDNILPSDGGPGGSLAILSYEFARRLVKRGHQVCIFGAGPRFGLQQHVERQEGIEIRSMRAVRVENKLFNLYQNTADKFLGAPAAERPRFTSKLYLTGYSWQLAYAIKREQADIVHIHNLFQLVPAIRTVNPSVKIVLHMNCEWLSQLAYDVIERYTRLVDLVVGSSGHITGKVQQRFDAFAPRCRTVYNGVDVDGFREHTRPPKADGVKRLLFVGRVSPEKGVHLLVEAFSKVHETYPNVEMDIVGGNSPVPLNFLVGLSDDERVASLARFYEADKGTYWDQVNALVPAALAGKVHFRGAVPYAEIAEHYRSADIYVNASYSESFCMPVAEAMAHGLPVVAARVGGIQEIVVHGQTGYMFDVGDVDGLANGVTRLLHESSLRQTMGQAGRQRVLETFAYDRVVDSLEIAYEDVLRAGERVLVAAT